MTTWLLIAWWPFVGAWALADRLFAERCVNLRCGASQTVPYVGPQRLLWLGLAGFVVLTVAWWLDRERPRRPVVVAERSVPFGRRAVWWSTAIGVVAAAHLFLVSPLTGWMPCTVPIAVGPGLGYPFNCDSPLFLHLAHHPEQVLDPGNERQSRPGYVALSAVATAVLGPPTDVLGLDSLYGQTDTAFVPLVLINLVVAVVAVALLVILLLRLGAPPVVSALLGALAVANPLTKAYYWAPHQQMFALLTPVVSVLIGRWLWLRRPAWWVVALIGSGLGLGLLVYGNLLVLLGTGLVVLLFPARPTPAASEPVGGEPVRVPGRGRDWLDRIGRAAMFAATGLIPTVVWIAVCEKVAGSYYSHELVAYHQFIWLWEASRYGLRSTVDALNLATAETAGQFIEVLWPVAGLLLVALVAARVAGISIGPRTREQKATLVALGLTTLMSVGLLWSIGLWAFRLTYTLLPLFLIAIGWVAARLVRGSPRWATGTVVVRGAFVAVWLTVLVRMEGPYS